MMDYKCPRCDEETLEPGDCDRGMEDMYRVYMESVTDKIESVIQHCEEIKSEYW